MEKLKVRITFRSGSTKEIESNDFYKGQFKQWCEKNIIKNQFQRYGLVVWNNTLINVDQIEFIDEV